MGKRSDAVVLVLERGGDGRTLFRVCRSWQCMYVLTILMTVGRDTDRFRRFRRFRRSITPRRCDCEPIILRIAETMERFADLHVAASWNQKSQRLNFPRRDFCTALSLDIASDQIELSFTKLICKVYRIVLRTNIVQVHEMKFYYSVTLIASSLRRY